MLIERTASMICGMSPPEELSQSVVRQLMDGRNVEENFRWLFERYYHAVSSFFFRKRFSSEDCRDRTQEVFLEVHRTIKNLENEDAFLGWLFQIANHVALRHWERQRSRPRLELQADAESEDHNQDVIEIAAAPDPDPESQVLDSEKLRVLQKALEDLPNQMRKCMKMRIYDNRSNAEIASELGISPSTVAVQIHRGTGMVKAKMDQYFEKQPFAEEL